MKYKPEFILVDRLVEHLPTTNAILQKFKGVDMTVIENVHAIKRPANFGTAKKTILITSHRGEGFKPCQGIGHGHICCNYWVLDLISNCPLDCSYCILQHYLGNNPFLTIYANADEILTRASIHFAKNSDKRFRVGPGELSDSLALDHITGFSTKMIEYFAPFKNVTLELKTKTANIGHLLKLGHNGRTVISWSVNPQKIIETEEAGTASLNERFDAAKTAIDAGFDIGFHFDPIICTEDSEDAYRELAERIIQSFPYEKIAWISLGTLRFPPHMKEIIMKRFPRSRVFYNELVPINGKVRYFRPIRERIYKQMLSWFEPLRETTPVYLCMETKTVWENVMPGVGTSNANIERYVANSGLLRSRSQ